MPCTFTITNTLNHIHLGGGVSKDLFSGIFAGVCLEGIKKHDEPNDSCPNLTD